MQKAIQVSCPGEGQECQAPALLRRSSSAQASMGFWVLLFQTESTVTYFAGLSAATLLKKAAKTQPLAKKEGNELVEDDRCPL